MHIDHIDHFFFFSLDCKAHLQKRISLFMIPKRSDEIECSHRLRVNKIHYYGAVKSSCILNGNSEILCIDRDRKKNYLALVSE